MYGDIEISVINS